MKRRELIALVVGAAASSLAWPSAARAQQAIPVIGYFYPGVAEASGATQVAAFRKGLGEAARLAALVDPSNATSELLIKDVQAAAEAIGQQIEILAVSTNRDIEAAFTRLQKQTDALLIGPSPLFGNRGAQLVTLATHYRLPTMYFLREHVEAGGLMSYGSSNDEQARQIGIYVGRILKGEKPGDLPVQLASKFEFAINLQTARLLGIEVPPTLLAIADEVIE